MMKSLSILLLWVALEPLPQLPPVSLKLTPTPEEARDDLRKAVCLRTSTKSMLKAYRDMPKKQRPKRIELMLIYDTDGRVIDASIGHGSGNKRLDNASLKWSRKLRLCPLGASGEGKLPVEFILVDEVLQVR